MKVRPESPAVAISLAVTQAAKRLAGRDDTFRENAAPFIAVPLQI